MQHLEVLGVDMTEAAVRHVLSLTSYHPALIQLLCGRLLEHARRRAAGVLPVSVDVADVDAVFRERSVREGFVERFTWTLDLDDHYGVLTRAMVLDQVASGEFARAYSVREVQELGAYWWEAGFAELSPDEIRSYVEELVALGVLTPAGEGRYRLRTPNTVRLLGTRQDIEDYLERFLDLGGGSADPWSGQWAESDQVHPRVQAMPLLFSPLTQGQLRGLGIGAQGVSLVMGTPATGSDDLFTALEALSRSSAAAAPFACRRLSDITLLDPAAADREVGRLVDEIGDSPALLLVVDPSGATQDLPRLVRVTTALADRSSLPQVGLPMRVLLSLRPPEIFAWLDLPAAERDELEAHVGAVTLARWSPGAVKSALEELDIPHAPAGVDRVLEATSGYHWLVRQLLGGYQRRAGWDLGAMAQRLTAELEDPDSPLRAELQKRLGLDQREELQASFAQLCALLRAGESEDVSVLAEMTGGPEPFLADLERLERLQVVELAGERVSVVPLARALFGRE